MGDEGQGVTDAAGAAGAADAVDVVLVGLGLAEVDDMGNVDDVDAAGGHVGSDQDSGLAALEAIEGALALTLAFAAVNGVGCEATGD